jgi:hypothetical protein
MFTFPDAAQVRRFLFAAFCAVLFALSACGGGSGGSITDGAPPPAGGTQDPGDVPPPPPAPVAWGNAEAALPAVAGSEPMASVLDGSGNAFAVWAQFHGSSGDPMLHASRYVPGTGWSAAQPLSTPGVYTVNPKVVVDSNGNAMAVWTQGNTLETQRLVAARYTPAGGWEDLVFVNDGHASVSRASVGFDAAGNAIAIWAEQQPEAPPNWSSIAIYSARFTPATGWEPAQFYASGSTRLPDQMAAAVSPGGSALLVYSTISGGGTVRAATYDPDNGWTSDELIHTDGAGARAEEISVFVRADRRAVAGWRKTGPGNATAVMGVSRDDETIWGDAVRLDDDTAPVSAFNLAMDSSGGATAVWVSEQGGGYDNRLATRRFAAGSWSGQQYIDSDPREVFDIRAADSPSASAAGGKVVVAWRQYNGTSYDVKARMFQEGAWGEASLLETQAATPRRPLVSGNPNGQALVTWTQGAATPLDVWFNVLK